LGKILQKLTQLSILNSYKGPNGGVCLAKPASEITLYDIVEAIDGLDLFEKCVVGLPSCGSETTSVLHEQWKENRIVIENMFKKMTVLQLILQ